MNTSNTTDTYHIDHLREHLFGTLQDLRNIGRDAADKPLDVDQVKARVQIANAIKGVADTIVDTAKVQVDFIKTTGASSSAFLETPPHGTRLPAPNTAPAAHNPFPVSARHRLGD